MMYPYCKYADETEVVFSHIMKNEQGKEKIYIEFTNGMKDNFAKFINSRNEDKVKYNQKIVNLIINIIEIYGLMQVDYELHKY